ncbi:uncharacterized protein LOC107265157 isoform X2 [Cephus cinctus]|uniref:Uncharacterized protein LOC107265157 isoform X2 n=1 Tax=Cephus cinctus TaxID=211228 RepID=A0AAJ7FFV5_CEPCN|nr:uncharacterized protein LOC107265157 isoform X2 [Cephus cinctus]
MVLQMTRIFGFLVVTLLLSGTVDLHPQYRLKEDGYILRSCTASAQLTRKHRNKEIPGFNVPSINSNDLKDSHVLPTQPPELSKDRSRIIKINTIPMSYETRHKLKLSGNKQYDHTNGEAQIKIKRLNDKFTTDTPLKTVRVEAIRKNGPLLFKKKDPLPELPHNVSNGEVKMDAAVFVIKPPA